MNKILLYSIVTIVTVCQGIYSQDFAEWENCSEGMWGNNTFDLLFAYGNDLYTKKYHLLIQQMQVKLGYIKKL